MCPDDVIVVRHSVDRDLDGGAAVVRALALEPPAVVYDLTGGGGGAPPSETLDAVDAYLSLCSGTPLLVATDDPGQAAVVRSHRLGRRASTWVSLDEAMAAARRLPPPDRFSIDLDPVLTAPRQARSLVRQSLARWQAPELVGAAWSVITELVNNAVVHAATPINVSISRLGHDHEGVRMAVRDGDPTLPVLAKTPLSLRGHGLWLVNGIARGWGAVPLHDGKIVWAVLEGAVFADSDAGKASAARMEPILLSQDIS